MPGLTTERLGAEGEVGDGMPMRRRLFQRRRKTMR